MCGKSRFINISVSRQQDKYVFGCNFSQIFTQFEANNTKHKKEHETIIISFTKPKIYSKPRAHFQLRSFINFMHLWDSGLENKIDSYMHYNV